MSALLEYKCPCCGGAVEFDSSIQKVKCPYCDTEFDMDILKSYDDDLKSGGDENLTWETQAGSQWQEERQRAYGAMFANPAEAEIIGDENTAATSCPYCGNPVVMKEQFSGNLKPDYVIPFKLDKNAAKAGLANHLKGKVLLPKLFKSQNHIDEIKGIYVPFWLFDADVDADIRYKATKVRHWSDSRYDYTETSHFSVFRAGSVDFERVPVDGSKKMADDIMESIEPFNFKDAVDFQTAYLAGYLADKYDVTADDSIDRANQRIKKSTEKTFADTVQGYSSVIPESTNIRLSNGKAKYALYPVWLLNTNWEGKSYTFAMNGQTGKFVGDLPMDKKAFWRWLFGLAAAIAGVVFLITFLAWLL